MKNLITAILMVVIGSSAFAQVDQLDITWGELYKSKNSIVTDIINFDNGEFFAVKQRIGLFNQSIYLEKYSDLGPVGSVKVDVKQTAEKDVTKDFIRLGNDLWVLGLESTYDYARLHAQKVGRTDMKVLGEPIGVIDLEISRKLRYTYGSYDYDVAEDHSKIGFITQYPGDRDKKTLLGFQVYDSYFDILWENDIELEVTRDLIDIETTVMDASGDVFCLLKVYDPKTSNPNKRGKTYSFKLIHVNKHGLRNQTDLSLSNGKRIQHIHFEMDANKGLMLAGFFGSNCCTIEGSFFALYNKSLDLKKFSSKEFELQFVSEGLSERSRKKLVRNQENGESPSFENVDFRDFVIRPDGSIVLVGELYEVNTGQSKHDVNASQENIYLSYNSILVLSIDANGEIQWTKKILKRQLTTDDAGLMSGFVLAVNDDKLHFIFNDHEANLNVRNESELVTYSRKKNSSIVAMVTIDSEGEMTREELISQKELAIEIRPHSCEQLSSNQLLLFGMSSNKNQMALVTF